MRRWILPILGTGGLMCAVAGLLLMLFLGVDKGNRIQSQTNVATENPQTTVSVSPRASIQQKPEKFFNVIVERPLFAPTRRPRKNEEVTADSIVQPKTVLPVSVPAEASPPKVQLHGISGTNGKYQALIAIDGQDPEWFPVRTDIAQWRITEIGTEWVVFEHDDQTHRVELYQ